MHEVNPSRTALRVALRRAAHQIHDQHPLVLDDPIAVPILGKDYLHEIKRVPPAAERPYSAGMRAYMVTRSRLAEDTLAAAVAERGVRQYIVLGAGLDTFAYRNPFPNLRVFEIDHPATQAWKLGLLKEAHIAVPPSVTHVAVDFETDSLRAKLQHAGCIFGEPTVTALLGVVPYLTKEAFDATLRVLSRFAPRSELIFDYSLPRELLSPVGQLMLDSLAARVAKAGEPFQLFFSPEQLAQHLDWFSMRVVHDFSMPELRDRYLANRTDGLTLTGNAGRICIAEVKES